MARDEMGDQALAETPPPGATWRFFVASSAPAQPSAQTSFQSRTEAAWGAERGSHRAGCRLPTPRPPRAPLWLRGGAVPRRRLLTDFLHSPGSAGSAGLSSDLQPRKAFADT